MKSLVSIRLDAALKRAAGRGNSRSLKEVANAIEVDDDTLRNYRNDRTPITADKLFKLCDLLGPEFRAEALGERLERLLWVDDAGAVHETADLDGFAREAQGLPAGVQGDHAAALRRNNGWVSVRVRDGVATIRYHERGIKARAARRVADRLTAPDGAAAARRQVELEDHDGTARMVSIDPELPKDAALAVELAAAIAHLPSPRPPRIRRLRLDEFPHPHAKTLIQIAAAPPEGVLPALGRADLLSKVSILRRHNGSLYSARVGDHAGLSPSLKGMMVGPVSGIPDVRYSEVLHHCADETLAEGATCRLISMQLFGVECEWFQAAFRGDQDTYISYVSRV